MFYLDTAAFISSLFLLNEKVLCMIMRIMNNQNSSKPLGTVLPPAGIHMLFRQTERQIERERMETFLMTSLLYLAAEEHL